MLLHYMYPYHSPFTALDGVQLAHSLCLHHHYHFTHYCRSHSLLSLTATVSALHPRRLPAVLLTLRITVRVETHRLSKFSYLQISRKNEKERLTDIVTNHVILGNVIHYVNMYTQLPFNADIYSCC